ncbi:MAG: guanitoxin biosynthesis heme-dependent pre-guanitoxin N-hydroxylase GntA [Balneolaceae bacterium]
MKNIFIEPLAANKSESEIIRLFEDFIIAEDHPCIMAQAVFNAKNYVLNCYNDFGSTATAEKLVHDLEKFVANHDFESNRLESFIAVFPKRKFYSEMEFEEILWQQLIEINKKDPHDWDTSVSSAPEDKHFSFSIAGRAFFVVGMHPNSSRIARQSPLPAIAFNLHYQFDNLRERGVFEEVKEKIRKRDKELQGNINPMVEDFDKDSEAKQYSGRAVDNLWKCPFQHPKKNT